jgi:hypothetical protein
MIAPTPIFFGYGIYIFPKNLANGKSCVIVMSTSNYSPPKLNGNEGQNATKWFKAQAYWLEHGLIKLVTTFHM